MKKLIFLVLVVLSPLTVLRVCAQVQGYKQFNNEIDFNHDLSTKWALETNVGQSWTTKPGHESVFSSLAQLYLREWVHYMPSDKWKLSFFYAFYYNRYVPEIDQRKAPEWRSAVQATYYITRKRMILTTRWRIEDRHIQNADTVFEAVNRLRGQVKVVYPINGKVIAEKVFYGIGSEELFFKTSSKVSGSSLFDRNRLTLGVGYGITNNLQIEVAYSNEYLPRPGTDQNYNAFQCNIIFNNLLPRLGHALFGKKRDPESSDTN
ncbi:DUF2490 domain-containing protein [Mucilaginibacter agri]|uniref:DUF2490 domain-containing protein n=1 Tax=Mucilaginibacter agri TaxID=2695265 RepID=A0A966DXK2_9SPHI|nr:DUF2490 domain-containing protein [Mucilaginibacter agri]NCD72354.1 DUF2490 domain-containing protein [Mucilaginibacter agri]